MTRPAAIPFLIRPEQVAPFSLTGDEPIYESRGLIERDGAGSQDLLVNHFTLHPGQGMAPHVHPENDELYYILTGHGFVEVGGWGGKFDQTRYDVAIDSAVFIPAGTYHRLQNEAADELRLLTVWPRLPKAGSNPVYDGRIAAWGCSFRTVEDS